jgi:hypothetical protein
LKKKYTTVPGTFDLWGDLMLQAETLYCGTAAIKKMTACWHSNMWIQPVVLPITVLIQKAGGILGLIDQWILG